MTSIKNSNLSDLNLELRPAHSDDSALIASWLGDSKIRRYLSSRLRECPIVPELIKVTLKRNNQAWTLVLIGERPAGLIVLDDFDASDKVANIWYCLGDLSMRGMHIMPQAIKKLTGSPPLPVEVLTAWVGSNNEPSLRCLQRAGFEFVGEIKRAFRVDGIHSRIIFEKQISVNVE